jgi:hypothetical protein
MQTKDCAFKTFAAQTAPNQKFCSPALVLLSLPRIEGYRHFRFRQLFCFFYSPRQESQAGFRNISHTGIWKQTDSDGYCMKGSCKQEYLKIKKVNSRGHLKF